MIKTIRANNSSFANLGSVAIQPLSTISIANSVQTQTTVTKAAFSTGVLPVRQAILPAPVVIHDLENEAVKFVRAPTLTNIADMVSLNRNVILPVKVGFNKIMPTHALTLDTGRTYDPRVTQGFVTTTTKFQPFEQLTGIAHERPEIIMLTNFQPLFNKDVNHSAPNFINHIQEAGLDQFMTDAGRYLDAQSHIRNIRTYNVHQNIRMLKTNYSHIDQVFTNRADDFSQALNKLKDDASFLLNLVRIIESQKSQLDLRHDLYIVDPHEIADHVVQNFSKLSLSVNPNNASSVLSNLVEIGNRRTYNCVDTLVDLGYSYDSVKNVFASTKIWMQLLVELKNVLQHHSERFIDQVPGYQQRDNNPSTILEPRPDENSYFGLKSDLPSLPTVDELINLKVNNSSQAISLINNAWSSIYQQLNFKNEEARISALARLLTQEFKYSYALTRSPVKAALKNFYGFDVNQTAANTSVFDSIIGKFGNNITDLPAIGDRSLVSISQNSTSFENNNVGILTLETKYVEGDTGTLTPGGDYYFDRILETDGKAFNTSAIDALSTQLDNQLNQLSIIIDGFNLFSVPSQPDKTRDGTWRDTSGNFLSSQNDTIWELASQLINYRTGVALPAVSNDRLGAVYSYARNDNRVKTMLFLYTMCKISRSYTNNVSFLSATRNNDNTPLVDHLIDQVVSSLVATVPESRSTVHLIARRGIDNNLNTSSLTQESIKSAMKSGTQMTQMIERFMSKVISQFRVDTTSIQNNITKHGGYLDTIIMMVAFDFAISIVSRYSNQQIVGMHSGLTTFSHGQATFAISRTSTNHNASFNELLQRGTSEDGLTRQLIMTVINVLRKLSGSLKGISNYLTSAQAQNKLKEISNVITDPNMLRMLFSEQQIMMLASTVESLITANQSDGLHSTPTHSMHDNGSQVNKEIVILDESDVPAAMRDALNGYFSTGDFASQESTNKRILSIGIPLGFTQRLKQKVNIRNQKRATFENKRNDIVQVVVYKVDVQNAEIIYKPQRFMFEMSRFPTRYSTSSWLQLPQQPSINDIVNSIPTQCFTQSPDSGTAISISSGIEYASTAIANSDGVKQARAAFDDQTYSFLTSGQKAELLHNHVVSQLLESYIKLMTGINVAEYNYDMIMAPPPVESDFVKTLVEHTVAHVSNVTTTTRASTDTLAMRSYTGGVLFSSTAGRTLTSIKGTFQSRGVTSPTLSNPAGVANRINPSLMFQSAKPSSVTIQSIEQQQSIGNLTSNLDLLSHRDVPVLLSHFQAISGFANTLSSVSDINAINQKVLAPKQFDRVFNVIIDPRGFEIDVAKTISTPFGKEAFNLLLERGDILPASEESNFSISRSSSRTLNNNSSGILQGRNFPQGRQSSNVNNFIFRDRSKTQGDMVVDKYFVTIETFGEDEV